MKTTPSYKSVEKAKPKPKRSAKPCGGKNAQRSQTAPQNPTPPQNPTNPPHKKGRPTKYSKSKSDLICELLATGQPLVKICALETMPSVPTVMSWLWRDSPFKEDFLNRYTRAREQQAEILADQIISIADDDSEDAIFVEGKDASGVTAIPKANREFIQRSNLRVESRKWVAAKLLPKKYGDKLEVGGNASAPLVIEIVKFARGGDDGKQGK